jgi:hypothetical protein
MHELTRRTKETQYIRLPKGATSKNANNMNKVMLDYIYRLTGLHI